MSIIIGGDISPTEEFSFVAFESLDGEAAFGSATKLMREADVTIVNLEVALTEDAKPINKIGPNLRAPICCAETLKDAGVDICALANNHIFDFGTKGLRDTVAALDEQGIIYTGIGENEKDARKPLYFDYKGLKVAIVAVNEHEYSYALPDKLGVWGFDPFETISDIRDIKNTCDKVIVLYHGGKEQSQYPSPRLKKACRAMVKAGADVVLCQHSHCIGVDEYFENGYIMYGQGNFHFVKHHDHPHWQNGMMLELDFADKPVITYHPIVLTDHGVTMAEGEEKQKILNDLAERNEIFKDEKAAHQKWVEVCLQNQKMYKTAIANAFAGGDIEKPVSERFSHYLDCEAHTDIWRELFKTTHGLGIDED